MRAYRYIKGAFEYEAGQHVYICVPKISWFEWHPFSISSVPHEVELQMHVRVLGDWTKKLFELAKSGAEKTETALYIDGPYGTLY